VALGAFADEGVYMMIAGRDNRVLWEIHFGSFDFRE
jgi:hypothetical protein